MFEPKLIWKNYVEFPHLILSYEKFKDNKLIGVKIVEWYKDGITVVSSRYGYFIRSLKFLRLKLKYAKVKVIKNNKVLVSIRKSKYLYRMDLTTMIRKFIKGIKENTSIYLIKKLSAGILNDDQKNKTYYELGKRTSLAITPYSFYFLGLGLALVLPGASLLFSQLIALFIVFTSFYSVMVLSSKFAVNSMVLNFLLPFSPNGILLLVAGILFFIFSKKRC